MYAKIKSIIGLYLPESVKEQLHKLLHPLEKQKISEIREWYSNHVFDDDIGNILYYLPKCGIRPFPYPWATMGDAKTIHVYHDAKMNLPYVLLDNKRLYYPRGTLSRQIKNSYYFLQMIEQHPSSPHCYLTDDFTISSEDVVVDCGAAEGNFSLFVVDKVKKVYIFEPEEKWHESLMATFAPWREKVEIVPKYISDSIDENSTTLDNYFVGRQLPTFCKIDVEGYEQKVLIGGSNLLTSEFLQKIVVCTYHKAEDEECLGSILRSYNYDTKTSNGYMLFSMYDELKPPYFRKGLLRCTKK